jgi:hypothetical protein
MRESWSPRWAPHASGTYERALTPEGTPEPTWVQLSCSICGQTHQVKCESGAPTHWIQRWASVHLHRDVLDHNGFVEAVEQTKKET